MNATTICWMAVRSAQSIGSFLAIAFLFTALVAPASASEQTRDYLYTKFQNGDIPTQQDFSDLIDSFVHQLDDGLNIYSQRGAAVGSDGNVLYLPEGSTVGDQLLYDQPVGMSTDWPGQSGFMAFSFLDGSGETHYAYAQLSAGTPGGTDLYPLQFVSLTYEDQANTALVTTSVPEPSTLALAAGGLIVAAAWRLRRRRNHV
jgi:hypothetical protein